MQAVVVMKIGGLQNYLEVYPTGRITGVDLGKRGKPARDLDRP